MIYIIVDGAKTVGEVKARNKKEALARWYVFAGPAVYRYTAKEKKSPADAGDVGQGNKGTYDYKL